MRSGGGIGDAMEKHDFSESIYTERVIYDILFYIIFVLLILDILFGIIIDAFADLRD
jgi:hypothetical protein